MHSKKEQRHIGQLPLLSQYDEERTAEKHPGMPAMSDVIQETRKFGLPDSDAEHIWDSWLVSGFKNGRGLRIASWKAAIRMWHRSGFFPSQKKPQAAPGELMTNEILDALSQNPAYKKLDVQKEGWAFAEWCKRTGNKPLVTSFIKSLNAKL